MLLLLLAGILLIYLECNRPGWVVPGCLGCVVVLFSAHSLAALPLVPLALATACMALLLVALGIRSRTGILWAAAGGLLLAMSLVHLVQPNGLARVHPVIALLVSSCFTGSTVWLGRLALRARLNKLGAARDRSAAAGFTG
jgi:membrane-bound ClpP family serine protease